ncbi:MAG: hypothetical protein M0Q90_10925 [Bacteroidales bacterium]|nr:hypothetical protein [Bacteroidales bacterium]
MSFLHITLMNMKEESVNFVEKESHLLIIILPVFLKPMAFKNLQQLYFTNKNR